MSFKKDYPKLYLQIHEWVYKNIPKSEVCSRCKENKILEASNNSGSYTLSKNDWEWICKSCHAKKDKWGNLEKARRVVAENVKKRGYHLNKGRSLSSEHRQRLSEVAKANKNHPGRFKKGQPSWSKGKRISSVETSCKKCGKLFFVHKWRYEHGRGKFCSWECRKN